MIIFSKEWLLLQDGKENILILGFALRSARKVEFPFADSIYFLYEPTRKLLNSSSIIYLILTSRC